MADLLISIPPLFLERMHVLVVTPISLRRDTTQGQMNVLLDSQLAFIVL